MKTPDEIVAIAAAAKIVDSGASIRIPPEDRIKSAKIREMTHGWATLEIQAPGGLYRWKISEHRSRQNVKREVLRAIDPGLTLNQARSARVRAAVDDVVQRIFAAAIQAASTKASNANRVKIDAKINDVLAKRKERQKKAAYADACVKIRELFHGPLSDMDEEELIDIFRDAGVDHVMSS